MAGVALGDVHLRLEWPAWHLCDWAGSGCALGSTWSPVTPVTPRHFCVAGAALGDIYRSFTWLVWHLATSTFVLEWQRGTCVTGLGLVARLCPLVARDARDARDAAALLRGRRGTWRHRTAFFVPPPLCVAGMALMRLDQVWWRAWSRLARGDIDFLFALSHTSLSHTIFIFVTRHPSRTSLSHAIFHFHTSLSHTSLSGSGDVA